MKSQFTYIRSESLEQALDFLARNGPETSLLAGGTDLMIAIRNGEMFSRYVLDISRLPEARVIQLSEGRLQIGAAATFTEIIRSSVVQASAPVLVSACKCIGSTQIRNAGTLGGNVANASPAADGIPPLVVHRARALLRTASTERLVPVEELVTGPYRTSIQPGEVLIHFLLEPVSATYRHSFQRVARRRALAIARMSVAAIASLGTDGIVTDLRLSPGSVTPAPCRMTAAENHLLGKRPDSELIREAAEMVSLEMIRQSGIRHSTEYKKPAVEGLVVKALTELFQE
ncbi:MAG: FAD binding domain-containing protein [Deltaproteobacteria bacterium]